MGTQDNNSILGDNLTHSVKSVKSNKSRSKKSEPIVNVDSDDISLSQLELMANKRKLKKKTESGASVAEEQPIDTPSVKKKASSTSSSSTSNLSTATDKKKKREKVVQKESKNDITRREKQDLLFKYNELNVKGRWSTMKLDMNNTLDEIRNEYERISNAIQNKRSVAFFKRMLLLGVQGMEMVNTKFDPFGVDLDGWSESMGYSVENQEYDEVLSELFEKYKGKSNMSPEVRLLFYVISSAAMFTISKKISKLDSTNGFANFIGNMMGQQTPQPQMYQQQQQPQMYQQQQQPPQMYQNGYQPVYNQAGVYPNFTQNIPEASESTVDEGPSRLRGPTDGGIDIDNILKTMKERKKEKEQQSKEQQRSETTDDVFKNIALNTQKRGRGRPKKIVVTK